jgi:antitoxin FitA
MCSTCDHAEDMSVMIQIRHVPEDVHRKLKIRATEAGMSLSEFLAREVASIAARPSAAELRRKLEEMKIGRVKTPPEKVVREARDAR